MCSLYSREGLRLLEDLDREGGVESIDVVEEMGVDNCRESVCPLV